MVLKDSTKNKIKDEIIKVVDRVIKRRTIDEPFDVKELEEERPFHVALLPEEILKGRSFQRKKKYFSLFGIENIFVLKHFCARSTRESQWFHTYFLFFFFFGL